MTPRLSVIIPTRNAEKTIEQCLRSILCQTEAVEIIIQDGQSTDRTSEIALSQSPEIRLYSENDRGVYDAMNRGLARARGEWVLFLGADDHLASDHVVEDIFKMPLKAETRWICARVLNVHSEHKRIPELYAGTPGTELYWRNTLHHQGQLYHRSLFENRQFDPKLKILGDYAFNLELWQQKTPWQAVDVVLTHSDARGLSKEFKWSLYREELRLKWSRLPFWAYAANLFWVPAKFLYKRT